jgi:LCP family protein required for cell wall assembly
VAALGILVASGYGYIVYNDLKNTIGSSNAIGNGPKSKGDDQNILLIGLDSRKDGDGNDLPDSILSKLHAGSRRGVDNGTGGYNTNTLILMHVPGDGSRATAFSIPRDDYVTYVDAIGPQQHGKIKEAYGVTKAFKEDQLSATGMKGVALDHAGREAARKATISTVRALTGVPIDHFAEINLAGFYDLAQTLGGVDVCLKKAVKDSYSGADFKAGVQHLDGAQALAFVRQRHGLPNGDLDRTHRQQAFLSSVTHKLKSKGVFGDLGQMEGLLKVAKKDVVTDRGWDILGFGRQAQNLTNGKVDFQTLPIKGYGRIRGQDVNLIDPAAIRATVQGAFGQGSDGGRGGKNGASPSSVPSSPSSTVDVLNGGGHPGLAARVAAALTGIGYTKGTVSSTITRSRTVVRYGAGADADANKIASAFGTTAVPDSTAGSGHVQIVLGRATTAVPDFSAAKTSAPPPASTPPTRVAQPASNPDSGPDGGKAGGSVSGGGIPCVN